MLRRMCQQRLIAAASQAIALHDRNVVLAVCKPCSGCRKRSYSSTKCLHSPRFWPLSSLRGSTVQSRTLGSNQGGSEQKIPESTVHPSKASPVSLDPKEVLASKGGDPLEVSIKVQPTLKTKPQRKKTDFSKTYQENIYITPIRAMNDYLLKPSDLENLMTSSRRSPFPEKEEISVYLRSDVERRAIEIWGSLEKLQIERNKGLAKEKARSKHEYQLNSAINGYQNQQIQDSQDILSQKRGVKEYKKQHERSAEEKPYIFHASAGGPRPQTPDSMFKSGTGRVVLYAVTINGFNCLFKLVAWLYSGSHSMFAEFIHSLADTANQLILALGLRQSLKEPDTEHPYGWASFRNVSSLISGVGIFCLGAGLSVYHGIQGLLHPEQIQSLFWAIAILGGSFLSEGATLLVAFNQVRTSAKEKNMSFRDYVWHGMDPSTNVVLLEDMAAVLGVTIAATCMGITYHLGNPMADAIGSIIIGSLLGGVASFIIYTNTISLVGRSIPHEQKALLMKELEDDRMIRALHDVKATDMGGAYVRFKAEVDFDGREITRLYMDKQDLEAILNEMQQCKTIDQVEGFMLQHGEHIVDTLGGEVDRIENNLKKKHPEIRHVDLEQL